MTQSILDVEDFSIGTRQILQKQGLVTVEDVARWRPPADLHPLAFDNIEMVLDDLGFDWPPA